MTRRLKDIAALLETILDAPFAQPKTWTGQLVARNAKRGEAPSRRIECPNCDGDGQVRKRHFPVLCDRCRGRGWIEVDDYTERQVGSIRTEVIVHTKVVHCDVCNGNGVTLSARHRGENNRCTNCSGSGRVELPWQRWKATRSLTYTLAPSGNGRSGDPVLDCLSIRQSSGSYDELLSALDALHAEWPALGRLVVDVYIRGNKPTSERLERMVLGGLEFLSARMPKEIRVPSAVRQRQKAREAA